MEKWYDIGVKWPCDVTAAVKLAGRFPLEARGFTFDYLGSHHALHLHDYYGRIRFQGREMPLSPTTVTLSPAGRRSSYDLPQPGMHWCIHFDVVTLPADSISIVLPLLRDVGEHCHTVAARFAWIQRLHGLSQRSVGVARLRAAHAASMALQDLLMWYALFNELHPATPQLRSAAEAPDSQGSLDVERAVNRLLEFIQQNLHQPMTAHELASAAGLSQNYLAKLFRHRLGTTIPTYILKSRIERAQLLLTSTNWPVKQIASRVGLPDAQHFNKQFRHIAGCSPTQWRQRNG